MWEIWMDVGGTFTDCIARGPDGVVRQFKTLSSGSTPGRIEESASSDCVTDSARIGDPDDFWVGFRITIETGDAAAFVTRFDGQTGTFWLSDAVVTDQAKRRQARYELLPRWSAPVLAVRYLTESRAGSEVPPCRIRFGTTRGTNALLTRSGANTVLVTTRGFRDILRIGDQTRPELFELNIRKRPVLFQSVIEVAERLDASGRVLIAIDEAPALRQLREARAAGAQSVAICLLHAYSNSAHEEIVERLAREAGFEFVSRSSEVSPLIRIVPRGETTVLDAYLSTVLADYLSDLQRQLPGSSIRLMTSSGGLVGCDDFRGADSILSGPAGGVIGFAAVARQHGFERAIGFDMGGTSTDVARWEGAFEYDRESMRAGVRIAAPMLSIETVAAGGGSICGFDGQRLFVGPGSAGADPGPACYGAGGPLTVTDLNVYLGRIVPEHFPLSLDPAAVQRRLEELICALPSGQIESCEALAEGLLSIAVDHMVQAIRRISVAKGCRPSDYTLVCFGGAGGQLACTVARELGISTVLIHPLAGVLSAVGAGMADVRRMSQRSVLRPLDDSSLRDLTPLIAELSSIASAAVLRQGVRESQLQPPSVSLALRYVGTDSQLTIKSPRSDLMPDADEWRTAFEREHKRQFGFTRPDALVEIESVEVESAGLSEHAAIPQVSAAKQRSRPTNGAAACHDIFFEGRRWSVQSMTREDLSRTDSIVGPAILCEPTSTVVIEPGCSATVLDDGTLRITVDPRRDSDRESSGGIGAPEFDPILLELLSNRFSAIAVRMGETLRRTSTSTNVRERLDYSCALFDADSRLIVNAPHIPVHLGAMSETVRCVAEDFPQLRPGDVVVTNDPRRGGSHLPDITVVTPVFDSQAERLLFYVASRAHHAEIGGIVPGSMPPFSRNLAEEGVLIRGQLLVSDGRFLEEDLRTLLTAGASPSRAVDDNIADLAAQVAANELGTQQLLALIQEQTPDLVLRYMKHLCELAARSMRMALSRRPDGDFEFRDHLDDGAVIAVRISVRGDRATVDFSGTSDVLASNLNANRAITLAAVLYVFRCFVGEKIPLNSGVLDPVELIVPTCLLNPAFGNDPSECPAVVGGNVETSQRIVDVLLGALKLAAASQGTMNNLTFGDHQFGYYETIGGGAGATPDSPGADAVHTHMTNTRLTDPEVLEQRYPVRLEEFAIRHNSGGAGRNRGGDGIIRRLRFLRPLTVSMLSQRHGDFPPGGLDGGEPGKIGVNILFRSSVKGTREHVGGIFSLQVGANDILQLETPGGGGFGTPVRCENRVQ